MRNQVTYRTDGRRWRLAASIDRVLAQARVRIRSKLSSEFAVHVALADRSSARSISAVLEREALSRAMALGLRLPPRTVVLADRIVRAGGEAVGSSLEVAPRPDGTERIVLRLALYDGERQREIDELLADLDHQLLILYYRRLGEPTLRLVTRLAKGPGETNWERRLSSLDADDDQSAHPLSNEQSQSNAAAG